MSDNSNQTDNSTIENNDFPSDYTEYYYRCRISNIESGAEDFYYVVNTILYSWKEITKVENDNQNDCSQCSFIKQLIRYNNDFHRISQKIIDKSGIDTLDDYRKNFNLLVRIVNETMMFLSEYYTYTDKKIGNTKFVNKSDFESKRYINYNISEMPVHESNDLGKKLKKIKFKRLAIKISDVSGMINTASSEIIMDSIMFFPVMIFMLICLMCLACIILIMIINIIMCIYERNITEVFVWLSSIVAIIVFLKIYFPISTHIERRKRSYKQSENFLIIPSDKKKIKIKGSEIWSLIREIVIARFGSND